MVSSTLTTSPAPIPELIDDLPNISGWEADVQAVTSENRPVFLPTTNLRLDDLSATFAIALHMHQPTVPAGYNGAPIGHLQYMF